MRPEFYKNCQSLFFWLAAFLMFTLIYLDEISLAIIVAACLNVSWAFGQMKVKAEHKIKFTL